MPCPKCEADHVHRSRRTLVEHIFWAAAYRCDECGYRHRVGRGRRPWFSFTAACPHCGDRDLKKFSKRDHIERMYNWPLSRVQALLGAPLLYCRWCRLQFYDLRPRQKDEPGKARAAVTSSSESEAS